MRFSTLAPILVVLTFISDAHADGWRTYRNSRFGTTAEVPVDWQMQPPPANNDGRKFVSSDGHASISVYGGFRLSDTIQEGLAIEAGPNGGVVTYQKQGPKSLIVSGIHGNRIFYHKAIATCGDTILGNVWIEYPVSDKEKYNSLVTHIAQSLRGGHGDECE